jgi:integrase
VATIDQRKTKEGQDRWRVRIRRRGITETASFKSRSEASRWAREVEQAIENGLWHRGDRVGGFTLGWMLDRYLVFRQPNRDANWMLDRYLVFRQPNRDAKQQLEWWRHHLGAQAAVSISRRRILGLRRQLTQDRTRTGRRRSPAAVNRYMAALSGLFSWALRSDHLDVHPMKGIELLAEGSTRLRCLSDEERESLIAASRESGGLRLQTLVVLALTTGARRGELLRLQWSDLDIANRQVVIHGTGRLRTRTLPLPRPAFDLLGQLSRVRRIDRSDVFAEPDGRVRFPRAAWRAALESAAVEDFRFHDLRHSAASYLAQSGASLPEIAEILGTRTLQGVRRYSHLTVNQAPSALGRMHEDLFET